MKKLGMLFLMALMVMGSAFATTTTLSEGDVTMAFVDVVEVDFSLSGANGAQNIKVVVDPICKDLDGIYGCGPADDYNVDGLFSVTPSQQYMNDGDTITLTLETTITDEEDGGLFYYTVNGVLGNCKTSYVIGSETGSVEVPEFGVLAAGAVLAIAGFFIYRKRQ